MTNQRMKPKIQEGLTTEEVVKQKNRNLVNRLYDDNGKSVSEIIKSNVFTLFNIINIVLALAIICVGSF